MRQSVISPSTVGFGEPAPAGVKQHLQLRAGLDLAATVAAVSQISQTDNVHELTRDAVDYARSDLGLERVAIFLVNEVSTQVTMQGTWGTNHAGRTSDESRIVFRNSPRELADLRAIHQRGLLWQQWTIPPCGSKQKRPNFLFEARDWFAVTPLVTRGNVVGVLFNDTALSRSPFDPEKQERLALFGTLLAGFAGDLSQGRCHALRKRSQSGCSQITRRVVERLQREPGLTGRELAKDFCVSPGHLASLFKAEVGTSIVEYRNRLRLERYLSISHNGERNLLVAALEAGFGSYAQFHRVHSQAFGTSPRERRTTLSKG